MGAARLRPNLTLAWCGSCLLIADQFGVVGTEQLSGYYFRETRFLSRLGFQLSGRTTHLYSIEVPTPHELCVVAIHPELDHFSGGGTGESGQLPTPIVHGLPARAIQLRTRFVVRPASLLITTILENRAPHTLDLTVSWLLAADFADLLEVLDGSARPGASAQSDASGVIFTDQRLPIETHVRGSPGVWQWRQDRLETAITVGSGAAFAMTLHVDA